MPNDLAKRIRERLGRNRLGKVPSKGQLADTADALRLVADANRALGVSAYQLHILANELAERIGQETSDGK